MEWYKTHKITTHLRYARDFERDVFFWAGLALGLAFVFFLGAAGALRLAGTVFFLVGAARRRRLPPSWIALAESWLVVLLFSIGSGTPFPLLSWTPWAFGLLMVPAFVWLRLGASGCCSPSCCCCWGREKSPPIMIN